MLSFGEGEVCYADVTASMGWIFYVIVLTPRIHPSLKSRNTVNCSKVLTSATSASNEQACYLCVKKIAITTNKEYNEISTYTQTDCIPHPSDT